MTLIPTLGDALAPIVVAFLAAALAAAALAPLVRRVGISWGMLDH